MSVEVADADGDLTQQSDARKTAMFAKGMICDERPWPTELSWEHIENAVRSLDGRDRTDLSIAAASKAQMWIAGGNGRYCVYGTLDGDVLHHLQNPQGSRKKYIPLLSGNQTLPCPENAVVGIETALHAARAFAEKGEFDTSLKWDTVREIAPPNE